MDISMPGRGGIDAIEHIREFDADARVLVFTMHTGAAYALQAFLIAMALALEPALIIADEPTTALDVTTQAQILKLLKELWSRHESGILFITHDFGVVAEIADRVLIMRRGRIVERGPTDQVLMRPQDPYTQMLIAAVPQATPPPLRPIPADAPENYIAHTGEILIKQRSEDAWV